MEDILRNAFYEEAEELLQEIEDCILEMDHTGSAKENIDGLFRYVHTLKGSSAAMQINDMAKLTHQLEDVLGMVRDGKLDIGQEMIDVMLHILDELKTRVMKHKVDEDYEIDVQRFITQLDMIRKKEASQENFNKTYSIQIHLHEDTFMKGARLFIVTDRLGKAGEIQRTSWEGLDINEIEGENFEIIYTSSLTKKEIEDLMFSISDIEKVEVSELAVYEKAVQTKKPKEELQSVIRVNIKKLDQLLRIVEELSVDKERLKQLMKKVERKYSNDDDVKSIKSLDKFTGKYNVLGELKGLAGTAILGDGDFAYVLDVQTLLNEVIKSKKGGYAVGY
jgi:two-component system chemotaxis sensor kinase CheA